MKILLTFCFLLSTLSVFAQDEPQKALNVVWQVKRYDINATLADRTLSAKATLLLQNIGTTPRSRVTLRLNQAAEVISTKIGLQDGVFVRDKDEKINENSSLQRIVVNFPSVSANSTTSITIEYKLKVAENSGLQAISSVGSQFLPLSFWYPTPNNWFAPNGADYAPVNLTVNGAETVVTTSGKLNSQPFFVAGSWDLVDANGIIVYLPKGSGEFEKQRANELANLTSAAKAFVEGLLGKIDTNFKLVAVRRGAGFSDSGTILLDYGAFRRPKIDAQTVMTIAESVAKVWIGNAKLIQGESQGVIREGLPRFIANEFIEKQYGKESAENERFRQRVSYANIAKNEAPITVATPLDPTYYLVSANKGAMIWRLVANQSGQSEFFKIIKSQDILALPALRKALSSYSEILDYSLTNAVDTNLLVGLPEANGNVIKVNLRNTGGIPANVEVVAITEKGERLTESAKIDPKSFGAVFFKTTAKIVRTEIDPAKIYPQLDYSDDVAPREFLETNPLVAIKRSFDRQDFVTTEKNTRTVLQYAPHLDEVRIWLGRSLLSQNKVSEAEKEFTKALSEKLPNAGSMAWGNLALGEIAALRDQKAAAIGFFEQSIKSEGEYGATLSARLNLQKVDPAPKIDESIKSFFADFDKAAISGRKSEIELLVSSGEIVKFAPGVSAGQPEKWDTRVLRTTNIDSNYAIAETSLTVKRLGDETFQTGTAAFILVRAGNRWKLAGIESFEVR